VIVAFLGAWTLLILLGPHLGSSVSWPHGRVPLEAAGAILAALTAGMAYTWYSFTGSRSTLVVALALVALAFEQLVFALVVGNEHADLNQPQNLYLWSAGSFVAAVVLLLPTARRKNPPRPLGYEVRFLIWSCGVLALVGLMDLLLWQYRTDLPALSTAPASAFSAQGGAVGHLTLVGVTMGGTMAALCLFAAYLWLPSSTGGARDTRSGWLWLSAALAIEGFSQIHYLLFPAVLQDRVSTGDLLRITAFAVLLVGLLREMRLIYGSERKERSELEALGVAKSELAKVLTHDVMLSLGTIRNFAVPLADQWFVLDDDRRYEVARRIERETAYLRDLMDRTIVVLNLGAEAVLPELNAERILPLVADVAGSSRRGHLRVVGEDVKNLEVDVDAVGLRAVLTNLMSNAEKYSSPTEPIDVSIRSDQDEVVVSVTDHGAGIPPEELVRIFDRAARSPEHGSIPGWGVGLYIARAIVEAHGGRMWAASEPGVGSSFSFALPVRQESHENHG
jgi:signal transduction histidine kinase